MILEFRSLATGSFLSHVKFVALINVFVHLKVSVFRNAAGLSTS
jgi:hypothetical protein